MRVLFFTILPVVTSVLIVDQIIPNLLLWQSLVITAIVACANVLGFIDGVYRSYK